MIYRCANMIIEGNNSDELISDMLKRDFNQSETKEEYKQIVLKRLNLSMYEKISDKAFIHGLEELKILKRVYRIFSPNELPFHKMEKSIVINNVNYYVYLLDSFNFKKLTNNKTYNKKNKGYILN